MLRPADMNRVYWNRMARSYEAEIFSVQANDRAGLVADGIRRYGKKHQAASDIGCGIGHFLPLLSGRFRRVLAVDLSARCIARAQARFPKLENITYRTADLAQPGVRLPPADFALCVNAAIAPDLSARNRLLDTACRHLRPGGHLVLVVPALESVLLTDFRLVEWNLRDGIRAGNAVRSAFRNFRPVARPRLHEGVVAVDGIDTKHFLREELLVLLEDRDMQPLEIRKIEYPWTSEFTRPPRWMRAPYPWDWLVVARKVRARRRQ